MKGVLILNVKKTQIDYLKLKMRFFLLVHWGFYFILLVQWDFYFKLREYSCVNWIVLISGRFITFGLEQNDFGGRD